MKKGLSNNAIRRIAQSVEYDPEQLQQYDTSPGQQYPQEQLYTEDESVKELEDNIKNIYEWINYLYGDLEDVKVELATPHEPVVTEQPAQQESVQQQQNMSYWDTIRRFPGRFR